MASAFTAPLMSTIDSGESLNSHKRLLSHSRSSQRLTRPFSLPRIPSERLDPRSINDNHIAGAHDSGQKRGEYKFINGASLAANGSIIAPSTHPSGQPQRISISKRSEVALHSHKPAGASHSLLDQIPRLDDADSKADISATKMQPKSR
jgi:hypothetical protein